MALEYKTRVGTKLKIDKRVGVVVADEDTLIMKATGSQRYGQIRELVVDFGDGEGDKVYGCAWCDEFTEAYGAIRRHIGDKHRKAAEKAIGYLMASEPVPPRVMSLVPAGLFCAHDDDQRVATLQDMLHAEEMKVRELEELIDSDDTLTKLRQTLGLAQQKLREYEATIMSAEHDRDEAQEAFESAQVDVRDAMTRIAELEKERAELQGQIDTLGSALRPFMENL